MNSLWTYFLILLFSLFSTTSWAQYNQSRTNYTVLKSNNEDAIPFRDLEKHSFALIVPQKEMYAPLIEMLARYAPVSVQERNAVPALSSEYNTFLFVIDGTEKASPLEEDIRQLKNQGSLVVVLNFGEQHKDYLGEEDALLWAESHSERAQKDMAMTVFGGLSSTQGVKTAQTRLQYTFGEGSHYDIAGMTQKIDAIAEEAILEKATPGLVVMAIKDGQVIFEKAYGSHTYDGAVPTRSDDIFDLASISKIVGTTPVIMHLTEEHKIDLNRNIGFYLPEAKETNKKDISLRTVLLHEAGFIPFIPFYKYLKESDLQNKKDSQHETEIEEGLFLVNNYYREVMWPEMLHSKVNPQGKYVYSDISLYVMKEVAEKVLKEPMEEYVDDFLYRRIGMQTAGYNPLHRFPKRRIVPTERDSTFRKTLIHGFVHDEGAALAGGVAGHAGLFATANDLAIYGQLLLNRGKYGGVLYFQPKTVDLFTSRQSLTSRRGLGFDRRELNPQSEYPSKWAHSSVYGHTGFTGTAIWIDPREKLTYIFLSNRVHPTRSSKLIDLNIRSKIQDVIYEAVGADKKFDKEGGFRQGEY